MIPGLLEIFEFRKILIAVLLIIKNEAHTKIFRFVVPLKIFFHQKLWRTFDRQELLFFQSLLETAETPVAVKNLYFYTGDKNRWNNQWNSNRWNSCPPVYDGFDNRIELPEVENICDGYYPLDRLVVRIDLFSLEKISQLQYHHVQARIIVHLDL